MKLAIISAASSAHTAKIVNGLASRGHDVTLFSLPNHRDTDRAICPSVPVIYLPFSGFKGYFLNAFALRKHLRRLMPELVNAHFASGYGTLGRLCKTARRPYVLSVWGSDVFEFPSKSAARRRLLQKNLHAADVIFSTSRAMAQRTREFAPDQRYVITPFGVNTREFCPSVSHTSSEAIQIGFAKALSPKYGLDVLLRAYAKTLDQLESGLPSKLLIYGDGPIRASMQQLAQTLRIASHVCFCGHIPHDKMAAALQCCDIFCVPSLQESFGVSAVEAMSCGIPCITSDAEGLVEVILDGQTGYCVPKSDVNALSEKLLLLIRDASLRHQMGLRARQHVLAHYDWEKNLDIFEHTFGELISLH